MGFGGEHVSEPKRPVQDPKRVEQQVKLPPALTLGSKLDDTQEPSDDVGALVTQPTPVRRVQHVAPPDRRRLAGELDVVDLVTEPEPVTNPAGPGHRLATATGLVRFMPDAHQITAMTLTLAGDNRRQNADGSEVAELRGLALGARELTGGGSFTVGHTALEVRAALIRAS
jgi:hypothetical protein